MTDLKDRVALVTGAQQGIGRAAAIALAQAGADVAINWLDDKPAAEAVAGAVRETGRRALLVQADVGDIDAAAAMVKTTVDQLGRIDMLVNNAGVFPRVKFLEMTGRDWDHVLDINLKGTCFCAQAAARAMIAAKRPGAIVNLASRAISGSSPDGVHYCASKGGIVSLTRAMALDLAPHGIRVNAVAPGLIDTAQPRYGFSEDQLQAMAKAVPIGRMGQGEDIANLIVFLVSDKAAYMTGQIVHSNGGSYLP